MATLIARACAPAGVLAVTALGLSAGAMLAEGAVLVPYWRSLPPGEFLDWFAANHQRLVDFYSPVEIAAAVLPLIAVVLLRLAGRAGAGMFAVATALALAVLATYFVYFQGANASFAERTIMPAALPAELARWGSWQWARISLGVGAFVAAIAAVRR